MHLTLYSIVRKQDGKRFVGWAMKACVRKYQAWGDKGSFYQRIETVQSHLMWLTHKWKSNEKEWPYHKFLLGRKIKGEVEKYYVEVLEASTLEKKTIPGTAFMKKKLKVKPSRKG